MMAEEELHVEDIELETDEPTGEEVELEPEEVEVEAETEEIEIEDGDSEEEEETTEPEEEEEEKEEKTVPLRALEAERNKWKKRLKETKKARDLAKKIEHSTGKTLDEVMAEIDAVEQKKYVDNGVDPSVAQEMVALRRQNEETMAKVKERERDLEFKELKQSPMYSDIDLYRDEIEELADRKDIPVKAAYFELRGEDRFKEMEREIEQRIMNNLGKKKAAGVKATSGGERKLKKRVKATPEQEEMAKMAGMSVSEYIALTKIETAGDYEQFAKAKKKR